MGARIAMPRASINRFVQSILEAQSALEASAQARSELVETQVYIGLNDADTKRQERDTERYVSMLKTVCKEYGVPFSFDVVNGGYIHDNGEYTEEASIVLTFIDVDRATVDSIAEDLCTFFNQESVLITTDRIQARSVRSKRSK